MVLTQSTSVGQWATILRLLIITFHFYSEQKGQWWRLHSYLCIVHRIHLTICVVCPRKGCKKCDFWCPSTNKGMGRAVHIAFLKDPFSLKTTCNYLKYWNLPTFWVFLNTYFRSLSNQNSQMFCQQKILILYHDTILSRLCSLFRKIGVCNGVKEERTGNFHQRGEIWERWQV